MAASRRALLISNPGELGEENYCKGVARDIENWKAYLDSPIGGWWFSSEVKTMDRPYMADVRAAVNALAGFDFTLIAFAGHGWYSEDDKATVLTLRRGEKISELELRPNAVKRTIVLDCCREIRAESALLFEATKELRAMSSARQQKRQPDGQRCRNKFDTEVSSAARGFVVLHSSTPPEESGDDERLGGAYTSSLLGGAIGWADSIASKTWSNFDDGLSVVAAHELAEGGTRRRSGGLQNPYIEKPRTSGTFFPFAVFA